MAAWKRPFPARCAALPTNRAIGLVRLASDTVAEGTGMMQGTRYTTFAQLMVAKKLADLL
jgi:hypothetical protein